MGDSAPSQRTKVKRAADRGVYDEKHIKTILDEGLVAHVGIVQDGLPVVIPMGYARLGNNLLLHGSISSRLMKVRHFRTFPPPCLFLSGIPCRSGFKLCTGVTVGVQAMKAGTDVCVTVTVLDGLVLARSPFHHSMNYRSVVVFGRPEVSIYNHRYCKAHSGDILPSLCCAHPGWHHFGMACCVAHVTCTLYLSTLPV